MGIVMKHERLYDQKRAMIILVLMAILWASPCAGAAGEPQRVEAISVERFERKIKQADGDVLIVVLAAWCAPCRKELPDLVRLYNEYRSKGLHLVGMSVDYGGVKAIQPMIDRYGVSFPVYWLGEKGIAHYGISAIPLLMVVKKGEIADRITGLKTSEQLETLVERLIN